MNEYDTKATTNALPAPPKQISRQWNLLGMLIGAAIGAIPFAFPNPYRAIVSAICVGLTLPSVIFAQFGIWNWRFVVPAAIFGGVAGVIAWDSGVEIPDTFAVFVVSTGFMIGFFVTDSMLKRLDADAMNQYELRRGSTINEDGNAAPAVGDVVYVPAVDVMSKGYLTAGEAHVTVAKYGDASQLIIAVEEVPDTFWPWATLALQQQGLKSAYFGEPAGRLVPYDSRKE